MKHMLNGRWIDVEDEKHADYKLRDSLARIIMHADSICTEGSHYDALVCAQEIIDWLREENRGLDLLSRR